MKIKQYNEIIKMLNQLNINEVRVNICRNIKKIRKKFYLEYKKFYPTKRGTENPYSTENISAYLGISEKHYLRLESEKDHCKYISLDNLLKLSYIFDISINKFIEKSSKEDE